MAVNVTFAFIFRQAWAFREPGFGRFGRNWEKSRLQICGAAIAIPGFSTPGVVPSAWMAMGWCHVVFKLVQCSVPYLLHCLRPVRGLPYIYRSLDPRLGRMSPVPGVLSIFRLVVWGAATVLSVVFRYPVLVIQSTHRLEVEDLFCCSTTRVKRPSAR